MLREASDDSLEVQSMWAGDWSGELAQTHLQPHADFWESRVNTVAYLRFCEGEAIPGVGTEFWISPPPTESRGVRGVLVGGLGYKLMLFCDSAVKMVWTLVKIEGIYYLDVMCTNDERQNCRKPGTHYDP